MASAAKLRARWKEGDGPARVQRIAHALMTNPSSIATSLSSLLEGLPFRQEVATGCDLRGIVLFGGTSGANLSGCDFSHAKLEFNLFDCNLTGACFDHVAGVAALTGDLRGTSFRHADCRGGFLSGADLRQACFDDAQLKGARFDASDLRGASLARADCVGTTFVGARLEGCNFQKANLQESCWQGSSLDGTTDLRGAVLVNVYCEDLTDSLGRLVMRGVDLHRAQWDETTDFTVDPSASAREALAAIAEKIRNSNHPAALRLLAIVDEVQANPPKDDANWFGQIVQRLPQADRQWASRLMQDAFESLL